MEKLYYHIYNRGVNRQRIFFDQSDYGLFKKRLKKYKEKFQITLFCFCLLPNHIHMLICTREEETVSKFVGDLINAYTRSINVKHHRIGVLFGGKTKKKPVTNQEHLLWLIRYILLNPVKARLVDKPELWEHSSLYELKTNPTYPLTDLDELLSMFHSRNELYDFLKD